MTTSLKEEGDFSARKAAARKPLHNNIAKAEWFFFETILQPNEREKLAKNLQVNLNSNTLR